MAAPVFELPADVDRIELDWLAAALQLRPGCVRGYRRGEHAGGFAVTSQVVRLLLELEPNCASAPESVIAKFPNPAFARSQANCEAEIDFYTRVASHLSLPVPRCHHGAYDSASGRSVLLLEDLSDAEPGHPGDEGSDTAQTRAVLSALARLQAAFWGSAEPERLGLRRRPVLGEDPQGWLDEARSRLCVVRERYSLPPGDLGRIEAALEELGDGARRLDAGPFTLVHDDLHTQNFLLDTRGDGTRVVFLDWQDACVGHPARDLAQLLGGNARVEVQRQHAATLLGDYHRELVELGVRDWTLGEARGDLRLAVARMVVGYVRFVAEYEPRSASERATLEHEWGRMRTALRALAPG